MVDSLGALLRCQHAVIADDQVDVGAGRVGQSGTPQRALGVAGSEGAGEVAAAAAADLRPDGRPHSAGVGAVWVAGALYFTSGPGTRKSRNLAANPACGVSVRLRGIDLVLEGEAHRVTGLATLERVAAVYRTGGWPASVEGEALTAPYSAPSAGPAPWHLYRLTLHTAVGVATAEPHGATRWDFAH